MTSREADRPHDEPTVTHADSSATRHAAATTDDPKRIGHYRILQRLGAGGMGTVFEAEQDKPRRAVALKVIRRGLATQKLIRRFELEAQTLGRLQHPGIAQIYEAGTGEVDGIVQPFIAMELIRGVTLGEHVSAKPLTLSARLLLLAQICDAVHHAHQKSVLHRDLKPGNIIIDQTGQPKIVDFGVARIMDADSNTTIGHTNIGDVLGTISYMSPEQTTGEHGDADVRSDVYSLGVVGYELLSGRLPYDLHSKTITEAIRLIADSEPMTLGAIDRRYRGDLETIFGKALEKDKDRRYQSASELGTDIRRYLRDEPILARPASAIYQLQKLASRHRALVGSAVAVLVGLVVGLAGTAYGWIQAQRLNEVLRTDRDLAAVTAERAKDERDRANRRTRSAETINELIVSDLHRLAGASFAGDDKRAAGKILDGAAAHTESMFVDQPDVLAEAGAILGKAYRQIGEFEKAEQQFSSALQSWENRDVPKDDEDYLRTVLDLSEVFAQNGRLEEAEQRCRAVVQISAGIHGASHDLTVHARSSLANVLLQKGQVIESEQEFHEAIQACENSITPNDSRLVRVQLGRGAMLLDKGMVGPAVQVFRSAVTQSQDSLGREHPVTKRAMYELGSSLLDIGEISAADTLAVKLFELSDTEPADLVRRDALTQKLILAYEAEGDTERAQTWRLKLEPAGN